LSERTYSDTGSLKLAIAPIKKMKIESTAAKRGRSMKKREMSMSGLRTLQALRWRPGHPVARAQVQKSAGLAVVNEVDLALVGHVVGQVFFVGQAHGHHRRGSSCALLRGQPLKGGFARVEPSADLVCGHQGAEHRITHCRV
jgi:hypothetical protein